MTTRRRRETPVKRTTNGRTRWVARYTNRDGELKYAKPTATFDRQHEAQQAIDAEYDKEDGQPAGGAVTFGAYLDGWTDRHPRSARTNKTNEGRIRQLLDVPLEGLPLADWPLADLRYRHAVDLVAHMLTEQGRAPTGAQNVLRSVSAMLGDARRDQEVEQVFVHGVQVRASDPRATGQSSPPRVFSFEELHDFANDTPIIRALTDTGLRLGEVLGLHRQDFTGEAFNVRGSAHHGVFTAGDHPTKRHVRSVPVPPSTAQLIRDMATRIDTPILFPTAQGTIWQESNFRRQVWTPALCQHLGIERWANDRDKHARDARVRAELRELGQCVIRPHDCRHSWITNLRAAGVDPDDLAQLAGHSVRTQEGVYRHALGRSNDQVRQAIG